MIHKITLIAAVCTIVAGIVCTIIVVSGGNAAASATMGGITGALAGATLMGSLGELGSEE